MLLKPLVAVELIIDSADSGVLLAAVVMLIVVVAVVASVDGVMPVVPEVAEGLSVALVA